MTSDSAGDHDPDTGLTTILGIGLAAVAGAGIGFEDELQSGSTATVIVVTANNLPVLGIKSLVECVPGPDFVQLILWTVLTWLRRFPVLIQFR